jgi:hypothetical protein
VLGALIACGPLEDTAGSRAASAHRTTGASATASAGGEQAPRTRGTLVAQDEHTVIRVNDETEQDGGAERPAESGALVWRADGGVMVSADAGARAAELAWLVTRIDEDADRAGPAGPHNVRALAAYGVDGVRALVPVLRAGDARRGPYAHRVLELAAMRACRSTAEPLAPRRLVAWLASGSALLGAADAGAALPWPWARPPEQPWTAEALERLRRWTEGGLRCTPWLEADAR